MQSLKKILETGSRGERKVGQRNEKEEGHEKEAEALITTENKDSGE